MRCSVCESLCESPNISYIVCKCHLKHFLLLLLFIMMYSTEISGVEGHTLLVCLSLPGIFRGTGLTRDFMLHFI